MGPNGNELNISVVGLGRAAHTIHLPAVEATAGVRLHSFWDTNADAVQSTAARFPRARVAESFDEVCDDSEVDGVIVATPPESHHRLGMAIIRAGKAVLIEKPVTPTHREAMELVKEAANASVPFAVGHSKRFSPSLRIVGQLLREGLIGRPFYVGVHWAADVKLDPQRLIPPGYENYWWRWQDPSVGGGIGQDHIPHYLDLMRLWTGSEPKRVLGHNMNVARDIFGWDPEQSLWEDLSLTLVEMGDGALLRLETGVVGRSVSPLLGTGHGAGEWTEYGYVLATEGKLVFDLPPWDSSETGRIAVWRTEDATARGRGWTLIEQAEPARTTGSPSGAAFDTFASQMAAFRDWIAVPSSRPKELACGEDGAAAVAVVEAAYLSTETGRWVDVEEATGGA